MFRHSMLASALLMAMSPAMADPGYYVVTPYDNQGVRTIDVRYWTVQRHGGREIQWPEIGFAYGVNSRWTTELFMSYIGSSRMAMRPSTLNWQNDWLLTQGEWPIDVALHLQYIRDESPEGGHAVEWGPVLQTDVGRTQLNANLFFERGYGPAMASPTQMKYQWQVRHRWMPGLHLGAQGFGELGPWTQWSPASEQSHRAGPALFSTWHVAEGQVIKLQAAYLLGKTYGRDGHMFTLRTAWDF